MKHKILSISCIIVGILLVIVIGNIKIPFVSNIIKDISFTTINVISKPINYFKNIFDKLNNDLYEENIKLKNENNILLTNKNEIEYELNNLKNILDLKNSLNDYEIINSVVINRNLGYWYDNFIIDKGTNEGIEKNMVVINNEGLIGYIEESTAKTSKVKMITSNLKNKISVKINDNDNYIYGLLTSYKDGYFIIEGVEEEVTIDSIVTTTGMGDIFPSGIIIGKVKEIVPDNFDLSRIYKVKSDIDYNLISFVSVLKREI